MALKVIENFYDWPSTDFVQEGVTVSGCAIDTSITPRANAAALQLITANNYCQWAIGSSATVRFGLRVRRSLSASNAALVLLLEGTTNHCGIAISPTGYLYAFRDASSLVLGTAVIDAIPPDIWTWIEGKIVIHDSAGSIEVRVNGSATPALQLTGVDTRNGGALGAASAFRVGASTSGVIGRVTDVAVWDEAGESPTSWVGDCRVDTYLPSGAGSSTQFSPSAGANYQCVDDAPLDSASYVEASTNGHLDLYAMGDMGHAPPTIHAVAVAISAQKTDAGSGSLKAKMKSGATTAEGSASAQSQGAYRRTLYARGVDPNTSAAWDQAGVDALEAGVEAVI